MTRVVQGFLGAAMIWLGLLDVCAAAAQRPTPAVPDVSSSSPTASVPDSVVAPSSSDTLPGAAPDTIPTAAADRPAGATPDTIPPATPDTIPSGAPDTIPSGAPDTILAPATDTIPPFAGDSVLGAGRADGGGPSPPSPSASADSVMRALRVLPGFVVTEYHGESAVYRTATGTLRLEGNAQVTRSGDQLTADTIEYRDREGLVTALGGARVVGADQELDSEVLYYDVESRKATALGARTEIVQDATWFVTGDVTLEGTSTLLGSHARFTSCDLQIPHYHFETDQVMVIRDRILVARPARLYFGDVPVMVLPFVVQSLEQGRRSGFLTPRFGVNDIVRNSSGYTRQISDIGFYWAINDYMGAQVSTTWRSGAYTSLLGDLTYSWRKQFLNGNFRAERIWETTGSRQITLGTSTSWQPDERTSLSVNGRYASSSRFLREATFDPLQQLQDLTSGLSLSRRFDWGRVSLGADRRQSIATGDVSSTWPRFSVSPSAVTFFDAPPGAGRWFSNATFTPGVISGSRATNRYAEGGRTIRQDQDTETLRVGPSFSVGRFTVSGDGDLNRRRVFDGSGIDLEGDTVHLDGFDRDEGSWSARASFQQPLMGTSSIAPNISLRQRLVRDTLTSGAYVGEPTRLSFGVGLNTDLYGFFPGVGPYSAIRHRVSPRVSYSYAPEVMQTPLQDSVFGISNARTQNRVSLGITQSFEAKLNRPAVRTPDQERADSLVAAGDTVGGRAPTPTPIPSDPEKVTLLSLTTSPFEFDFVKAREEGNGFVTERMSNTITSDYLRGLTIQMSHELFDKRELDPSLPGNTGRLGRFAPRLTSLSTSFQLGPQSALFRWLDRLAFGTPDAGADGPVPPPVEQPPANPAGDGGAFTGNPMGTGGGPWRTAISYSYSRPPRLFSNGPPPPDDAVQTLNGTVDFQLTPNWSVNWETSYSITENEFGAHRLNFRRNLHEWQANFSFYQAPNGNTAFEFYVELLHNRDLRLDYGERNLGIDRGR